MDEELQGLDCDEEGCRGWIVMRKDEQGGRALRPNAATDPPWPGRKPRVLRQVLASVVARQWGIQASPTKPPSTVQQAALLMKQHQLHIQG